MRKFNVKVNGNSYVVEVEEESAGAVPVIEQVKAEPAEKTAPAVAAAPKAPVQKVSANGKPLNCPMPGKILKLLCKSGDVVKKNQKIIILEAMKMENDIVSPFDGVITYLVKEGDDVVSQQELAIVG